MLVLDIAYLCTNYDNCSFSRSRDIVGGFGAHQNLNGSRDLSFSDIAILFCAERAVKLQLTHVT